MLLTFTLPKMLGWACKSSNCSGSLKFPPFHYTKVKWTLVVFQRNPLPKSRRGSPAEGAVRGEEKSTCQRCRNPVLHLPILLQRPGTCTWRTQRLHQQSHVSVKVHMEFFFTCFWQNPGVAKTCTEDRNVALVSDHDVTMLTGLCNEDWDKLCMVVAA